MAHNYRITMSRILFFSLFCLSLLHGTTSTICPGGWYGNNDAFRGSVDTVANRVVLDINDAHEIDCYGVVSQINVRCHNSGTVRFQVWRPTGGTNFMLVGEYSWAMDRCEDASITLYEHGVGTGQERTFTDSVSDLSTAGCCGGGNSYANSATTIAIPGTTTNEWQLCAQTDYRSCLTVGGSSYIQPGTTMGLPAGWSDNLYSIRRLGYDRTLVIPNDWEHIPVQPGDRIGLANDDTAGVVQYAGYGPTAGAGGDETRYIDGYGFPAAGASQNFPINNDIRRDYAFRLYIEDGMIPLHADLPDTMQLAENVAVGTYVMDVRVKDWDYEEWMLTGDVLEYAILSEAGHFAIDSDGVITTNGVFDYETKEQYTVTVGVRDSPSRAYQQADLTVDITDVNEDIQNINLPATVEFDAQQLINGFEVFDVDATSDSRTIISDITSLVSLRYLLVSSEPNDGAFTINAGNGEVTVNTDLTLTQNRRYTLTIAVAETDGTYTTGVKTLDIVINNVDQKPYFTNLPATVSIPEDSTGPLTIYKVLAVDPDGATNTIVADLDLVRPYIGANQFTYTQATGLAADEDGYDVAIVAAPDFDFETEQTYMLPFYTTDTNFQSEMYYLQVEITDVNEAPVCEPSTYETYMLELLPEGTRVGDIAFKATDVDAGDTIKFQIAGVYGNPDNRYFDVEDGNKLVLLNEIDLGTATERTYTVNVEAVDSGGLKCDITVTVHVMDVNIDHEVTNLPRTVELNALTGVTGDTVYTVGVAPMEANDVFTYSLSTPAPSDGLFTIDETTGEITLTRDLAGWTYDGNPLEYNMTVTVTDEHGKTSGPQWIYVKIANPRYPPEIDNLPTFISYVEPHGHQDFDLLLFTVSGVDDDGIGIMEYELLDITPRLDEDMFVFDTTTGELFIKEDIYFNYERNNNYTFTFRVKDDFHWSPPATLYIEILDTNERPQFTYSDYVIELDEETPIGTLISISPFNLTASDPDAGNTWDFESGYEWFTVVGDNLRVNHQFDRETETYENSFVVYVRDQDGLQDSATVTLTYNDINDNAPVFGSSYYEAIVYENAYGGTNVLKVTATDADAGANGNIVYSVRNVNGSAGTTYFQVHRNSGIIYVKHRPDYALHPSLLFEVVATDKGIPSLQGSALVNITIIDTNDVVPTFAQDFYNLDVPCDEPIGNTVVTVSATDNDADTTNELNYFYLRFNREYALHPQLGDVTVREALGCEKKNVLYILARDRNTTDGISNVCMVRINQYNPILYVVDIYLAVPIGEYEEIKEDFVAQLDETLAPWKIHVKEARGELDRNLFRRKRETAQSTSTIVSVYATEHSLADDRTFLADTRAFVPKDTLLPMLRKDISGTPQSILKTPEYSEFFVTKVEPQSENWFLDTTGGIVTTFFLTVLGVAALGVLLAFLWKIGVGKWWTCCKPRVRTLRIKSKDPEPEGDHLFSLRYKHPDEYVHTIPKTVGVIGTIKAFGRGRATRRISTPPKGGSRMDGLSARPDSSDSFRTSSVISHAASPGQVELRSLSPDPDPRATPQQRPPPSTVYNVWEKQRTDPGQKAHIDRATYGSEQSNYRSGWRDALNVKKPRMN